MKKLYYYLLTAFILAVLTSCTASTNGDLNFDVGISDDSGNGFHINLKLPIDTGACFNPDDGNDMTYCITTGDTVKLSIYSTSDVSKDYLFDNTFIIPISDNSAEDGTFSIAPKLIKKNFYRFYIEVVNSNGALKMTGGISGFHYLNETPLSIFLAPTGDFARVVSNRMKYEDSSLKTYFDSAGSRGSAAVALKGGLVYLSGGYSFDYETAMPNTTVFDMKNLTSTEAENLETPLEYHAAALLDDGSQYGKAVVAFGTIDDGNFSSNILLFDPEKGIYATLGSKESVTKAKAITIDGKVYIIGGCNESSASSKIYVVDNQSPYAITEFASMKTGRCNHALADVSTVDAKGVLTPRILIIGGSSDIDGENPIVGDNMVELATPGSTKALPISDREGEDRADLTTNGLVSPAASTLKMDDLGEIQKVVVVVGGYLKDGSGENATLVASPNLYVLSENGDSIIYDVNSAPYRCVRPSMATIGTTENSPAQYAAVNCGSRDLDTDSKATDPQKIFVVQVKRSFDSELNTNVLNASVKSSLMDDNRDPENGVILNGPTTVDELGNAFIFGTKYVYQVGGYSIPYTY